MIIEGTHDFTGAGSSGVNNDVGFQPPSLSLRLQSDMFGSGNQALMRQPPDFLIKTFHIVNDPNTNSIISWGSSGTSFIIRDHLRFTAEILHLYFKHNNFSSFIYQLNTYGFRKIGVEHRWEYENPNFQAGKEHLLRNITRRSQNPAERVIIRRRSTTESETLRTEINKSKLEIQKLKTKQSDMEFHAMAFESKIKSLEKDTKKLIMIWAKACDRILGQKIGGNFEIGDERCEIEAIVKKRKLGTVGNFENPVQEEMRVLDRPVRGKFWVMMWIGGRFMMKCVEVEMEMMLR